MLLVCFQRRPGAFTNYIHLVLDNHNHPAFYDEKVYLIVVVMFKIKSIQTMNRLQLVVTEHFIGRNSKS